MARRSEKAVTVLVPQGQEVKLPIIHNLEFGRTPGSEEEGVPIRDVARVVAWTFAYAPKENPMNEENELWIAFFAYSEWFRILICGKLDLPIATTKWEEIYRIAGFMVEEAYESKTKFKEAVRFGKSTKLADPWAKPMLSRLEGIKFLNDGLI